MARIIKIEEDKIVIGTDDNKIKEIRKSDVNFDAMVNDEVEIFENDEKTFVVKSNDKKDSLQNSEININLSNNQNGQPVYIANNTKVVNKTTYCLLAFFLGGIGIHKFYAGKTSSGILYLIFFWTFIPAFIAFIEFIVALCKKADSNGNILI